MLGGSRYCPILYSRVSEIKALSNLPSAAKDLIFPLINMRPWPNAKELGRSWEKIGEALGNRRFGLDIDRLKLNAGSVQPASSQFDALFSPINGFSAYYDAVAQINWAVPVFQMLNGALVEVERQKGRILEIDRGAILWLRHDEIQNPSSVIEQLADFLTDNVLIVVDAGWSLDILDRELWVSSIITQISDIYPEIEIVVASSSFPNSFAKFGTRGEATIKERMLYDALVRRHNAANLIYGDWGSTRKPSTEAIPVTNVPRIDIPTTGRWTCVRAEKLGIGDYQSYVEVALRALEDPDWPSNLEIWGTYFITATSQGLPGTIRSAGNAAAARINIHLYKQAYFGLNDLPGDQDEPYDEDL